jgi:ABC-2 type transport system permease protein
MATDVALETLRDRRRSLLWWILGVAGIVALNVVFYPSVRDDPALNEFARDLPESVRALFVGGELDLTSPVGYLNSQVYALMAPLLLLIFAIGAGAGGVAGEEERGTLDLLLAQPLRRRGYVTAQFAALGALVAALSGALLATVAVTALLVDLDIGLDRLLAASVSLWLLGLLFGSLALAVGAITPGRTRAIAAAAGVAVLAWLLDGLAQTVGALEPLRPVSPYYQAMGRNPLGEGAPWTGWALIALGVAVAAFAAAWGLERRDVRQ